ncbi:MAG TPA: dihydrodipicolinate reductase [Chloroflexota bacterium]
MLRETLHVGLGAIGQRVCATGLAAGVYRPVAAVDPAPALIGRDLGDLIGVGGLGVPIRASLEQALAGATVPPRLALHATRSTVTAVRDELIALVGAGCDVVSTCEELAAPRLRAPEAADAIDAAARAAGRRIVGAGVNPGFAMDLLPLALAQAATAIRSITIRRVQDPLKRRRAFQHKVGIGRSKAECEADVAAGAFGHVGLRESAAALAAGLGWELGRVRESLSLVLEPDGRTVRGVRQTFSTRSSDGRLIRLIFHAIAGARRDSDQVVIDADPPLRLQLPGGLAGDQATANLVLSAARRLGRARPGLLVGADLPLGVG